MQTVFLAGLLVLFSGSGDAAAAVGPGPYGETVESLLRWGRSGAVGGAGWLVGLLGWLLTAHHGSIFLLAQTPRAWRQGRRGVLTSGWPLLKYLCGGILLLVLAGGLGAVALRLSPGPFRTGIWIGLACGVYWTVRALWRGSSRTDFLLANRRYVDERAEGVLGDD